MQKPKILITDGLHKKGLDLLSTQADVVDDTGISADDLLNTIGDYDAIIVRGSTKLAKLVIEQAHNLKVIGRAGVGVDNIDLTAAKAQNVIVVNAPEATTISVAEHTIALMLALLRNIPAGNTGIKQGEWLKSSLIGKEIYGKTIGIIGMGRIGSAVALLVTAFGAHPLGYDPFLSDDTIQKNGAFPTTFVNLLEQADIVTLHLPLSGDTHNLINDIEFSKMKEGVNIICAARGGIINERALLAAVESGKVAGVALDVFEREPPGINPLVLHPNVIATPHIGAQTQEAKERVAIDIATEVLAALNKQPLRWRVV